ncbi:MAG: hypothetical protein ACI8UO_001096 [Verrucomicrobiales bacterium]|jgi:hypothetical protein
MNAGIPERLHTNGRTAVDRVDDEDNLFMRHEPLPSDGHGYGAQIPGHRHLNNQSVNSDDLNSDGWACDVLLNTKTGNHYFDYQIACFRAGDIRDLTVPNENTTVFDNEGNIKRSPDIYEFKVRHDPADCMYPHCLLLARKNGGDPPSKIGNSMKTVLRKWFAKLAERNREKMSKRSNAEFQNWESELLNPDQFL